MRHSRKLPGRPKTFLAPTGGGLGPEDQAGGTLRSKLPEVGTTIFSVMSALAAEHGAINLSQGFPDFPCDPALLEALAEASRVGHNQYAPMAGLPALREAIAAKLESQHGLSFDPDTEITVTAGGTQALFTAIAAVLHAGDEAILLDPSYDSYAPAILAQGAKPVHVGLTAPHFAVDWDGVEAAVTPRTRLLLLNNPNVYDGQTHRSVLAHPGLRPRSFAVYSFGKTFHATGWKLGYCVAPPELTREFRKLHQFLVFSVNTPAQHAIAAHLAEPERWRSLSTFFEAKRDRLATGLAAAGFALLPCRGTYFQLADFSAIRPDLDDLAFARWLTAEHGVASIPVSPFYRNPPAQRLVRFCFAKQDATLAAALERLAGLK